MKESERMSLHGSLSHSHQNLRRKASHLQVQWEKKNIIIAISFTEHRLEPEDLLQNIVLPAGITVTTGMLPVDASLPLTLK